MNLISQFSFKQTISTLAISTLIVASGAFVVNALTAQPAFAQADNGQGKGGSDNQGGSGNQGGSNSKGGPDNQGGTDSPGSGKPNWADADLVDMGRLNILKARDDVLNHAVFEESNANFSLYELQAEDGDAVDNDGDFVETLVDLAQIVDSPVANMGLLKSYWEEYAETGTYDGYLDYAWTSHEDGETTIIEGEIALDPYSFIDFSAITIGIAIDKTVVPTEEIVNSLATVVWGKESSTNEWPDEFDAALIAAAAAAVQEQVVIVHDQ